MKCIVSLAVSRLPHAQHEHDIKKKIAFLESEIKEDKIQLIAFRLLHADMLTSIMELLAN